MSVFAYVVMMGVVMDVVFVCISACRVFFCSIGRVSMFFSGVLPSLLLSFHDQMIL